jgi:hypothetical protein
MVTVAQSHNFKTPPHFTESRKKPTPNHPVFVKPQTTNNKQRTTN